jgi:hypothetical protein
LKSKTEEEVKGNAKKAAPSAIVKQIVGIREKWHTKNHPFFQEMAKGKLPLRALGMYMAQHYRFVELVLPAFGHLLARTGGRALLADREPGGGSGAAGDPEGRPRAA